MDTAVLDIQIAAMNATFGQARSDALHVEIGRCDTAQLAGIKQAVSRLANVLDAVNADIAARAAELRLGGNTKPVDDAVNPGGRQSPQVEKGDKDRSDVFGALPGLEDATKSGELSGRYADIVAKALKNVNSEVRAEFVRRHQDLGEIAACCCWSSRCCMTAGWIARNGSGAIVEPRRGPISRPRCGACAALGMPTPAPSCPQRCRLR
jgi:hypothetical protein